MNLILFILALVISFTVVRIGAIAFEITGLNWTLASFQSISCFTGTGFTTRESELITSDPKRRKIATILMVLGYAGLATFITTLINSMKSSISFLKFNIPVIDWFFTENVLPFVNLITIIISIFAVFYIFSHTNLGFKITKFLKKKMIEKKIFKPSKVEVMNMLSDGFGLYKIKISPKSKWIGKSLNELDKEKFSFSLLAIENPKEVISNPDKKFIIKKDDKLICFGKIEDTKNFFKRR